MTVKKHLGKKGLADRPDGFHATNGLENLLVSAFLQGILAVL
jgi:hypothetical protein